MAPIRQFAKIGLLAATIFVLGACSELAPAKKTETSATEVLTPASTSVQLDPASTDDVVTAIEEAKRLVPFILNALTAQGGLPSYNEAQAIWSKIRIVTNANVACEPRTDICLNINELKETLAKASLVRALASKLSGEIVLRVTGDKDLAETFEQDLNAKLPAEPKTVLFPRIEVLYQNSNPNSGVLRVALRATLAGLENSPDWISVCKDLNNVQNFAAKLGQSADEKSQMLASLNPDAEAEESSILRRTSNLKVYCEGTGAQVDQNLFQNAESLKTELQEAETSLDKIFPAAKDARDLIRTFRL